MEKMFCTDAVVNLFGLFDTTVAPPLLYYAYIPISIFSLIFGIFIFLKNRKQTEAKLLLTLSITFSLLILNEIMQWVGVRTDIVYFGWQLSAFFQAALIFILLYFVWTYFQKGDIGKKPKLALILLFAPILILLPTEWNVNSFDLSLCGTANGPLWYYIYALEISAIPFIAILGRYYLKQNTETSIRKQIKLLSTASILLVSIITATNIAGDTMYVFDVNLIGPIGMLLFIAFLAFMIVRFKAFSIKLLGTQALVTTIFAVTFAILFIRQIENVRYVVIATLVLLAVVGRSLIKSVKNEVLLREQAEDLVVKLDSSNTQLKASNENQTNLIHVMNHQIKGRLGNSRNIFAELITGDYGQIPETARPLLEQGLQETTTGVNYVTTILKGASAESGTLPYVLVPMDFKALVTDVANKQQQFAERKGLAYEFKVEDGTYQISGDTTQLSEAVKNLIDNSINYTPSGSISVSLGHRDGKIVFAVKDSGVGLADEDKPKLFRSGGRGKDSLSINVNSTGYGLAFVKGVVTAHSGRVWAESEGKGKGSQFYIELPEVK